MLSRGSDSAVLVTERRRRRRWRGWARSTSLPKRDFPAGTRPFGMIKADLNGDRKLDLATAGADGVNVLLGRGDGTFRAPHTIHTPGGLSDLRLTDLNGDRRKDFVAADYENNAIVVLLRQAGRRATGCPTSIRDAGLPLQPGDRRLQP